MINDVEIDLFLTFEISKFRILILMFIVSDYERRRYQINCKSPGALRNMSDLRDMIRSK